MKKRFITLLEIMIVILLIGIIGSVVGYNMKGSLDKGRAFKTKQAQEQIKNILLLEAAERDLSLADVVNKASEYLSKSALVKNADELIKDGWGEKMNIKIETSQDQEAINVISQKLIEYENKQKLNIKKSENEK
jgi:general secretion pathway protein G